MRDETRDTGVTYKKSWILTVRGRVKTQNIYDKGDDPKKTRLGSMNIYGEV